MSKKFLSILNNINCQQIYSVKTLRSFAMNHVRNYRLFFCIVLITNNRSRHLNINITISPISPRKDYILTKMSARFNLTTFERHKCMECVQNYCFFLYFANTFKTILRLLMIWSQGIEKKKSQEYAIMLAIRNLDIYKKIKTYNLNRNIRREYIFFCHFEWDKCLMKV